MPRIRQAFGAANALKDKALDTKVGRVLAAAEHSLMTAGHKTRAACDRAAELRGMSEDGRKRLSRCLAVADFAGGYASGAAGGKIAGPLGAKVGMALPTASAVYLAYSAGRDPKATLRAAAEVVAASSLDPRQLAKTFAAAWLGTATAHESEAGDWVGRLADLIHAAPDAESADWAEAVFLAAVGASHDPEEAVALAEANPTPPANDADPVGESAEVTETEYATLSESGRMGLQKVKRTDKNGISRYVYVKTNADPEAPRAAGLSPDEHGAHVAAVAAKLADPGSSRTRTWRGWRTG